MSAARSPLLVKPGALEPSESLPRRCERYRLIAAIVGLAVLAIAVSPPFNEAAGHTFSSHMIQHVLLIYLAAPLLAIAWPLVAGHWHAPSRLPGMRFLVKPAAAAALSTAALWLWHLPATYDFALTHPLAHVLEHLAFFATFLFYWRLLTNTGTSPRLTSNETRALYLLAGATLAAPLGAILTFSDHPFYSHYAANLHSGGRSPLEDQQFGGAIMWLAGPLVYGLAAILTMRED